MGCSDRIGKVNKIGKKVISLYRAWNASSKGVPERLFLFGRDTICYFGEIYLIALFRVNNGTKTLSLEYQFCVPPLEYSQTVYTQQEFYRIYWCKRKGKGSEVRSLTEKKKSF